jgi:hypothetical protein
MIYELTRNLKKRDCAMQRKSDNGIFKNCTAAICLLVFLIPGKILATAPEKPMSLESRLQRLEDQAEILLLLKSYGQFLDRRDFAAFSGLFSAKEGEWIGGMGKAKGSIAIRKLMEETIGAKTDKPITPNYHIFTNEMIAVNGSRATALSKWIFIVLGEGVKPQMMYLGHYEDSLVRENGRWKFLKRTVYTDIPSDSQMSQR